ncbi:twin-arginine translocase TatA/TatE family subunit [bacterium]|nr:twin-arginine translocase TatA/TatE family subunit [bacterium]
MGIGSIGPTELIIIFIIILLIFGGKKLPELARGLGKGIKEFKKATKDVQDELNIDDIDDDNK